MENEYLNWVPKKIKKILTPISQFCLLYSIKQSGHACVSDEYYKMPVLFILIILLKSYYHSAVSK